MLDRDLRLRDIMASHLLASVAILILVSAGTLRADTPANCTYEDMVGEWILYEGPRSGDRDINCSSSFTPVHKTRVELRFPNVAFDEHDVQGHWTLIYNQGFELTLNYRKYFAFSDYQKDGDKVTSFCDQTRVGFSHDVLGHNWACYNARKVQPNQPKIHRHLIQQQIQGTFQSNQEFVDAINHHQTEWQATVYREYEGMDHETMLRRRGGRRSAVVAYPTPAPVDDVVRNAASLLPKHFDWRNVSGLNYVSPIRNQGGCGSCYAFSSMGMLEARIRVQTNNTVTPVFSPQEVVSCSPYAQGCEGGFPYLVAGKYGQDYGVVDEACYPYAGKDNTCNAASRQCLRHYTAYYRYVGGFYGGCNEELMKLALVRNGPLSVSFEVYSDFQQYAGGIYHHTGLQDGFNPFAITNHAVLLVGYGTDAASGTKYWIVKNSWGEGWGEGGYFRIRRGNDECNIESIAVEAFPIP